MRVSRRGGAGGKEGRLRDASGVEDGAHVEDLVEWMGWSSQFRGWMAACVGIVGVSRTSRALTAGQRTR